MSNIDTVNSRNIRTCTCLQCGTTIAPGNGYSAPLASNGGRAQYICRACRNGWNDISYGQHAHAEATGKQAKAGLTYSVELEMREVDALTRGELAAVGFIATKDCTTEVEYKMPPRGNLNNGKTWSTVEGLLREGHAAITDKEGTHIHIGHGNVERPQSDGNPTPDMVNWFTMECLRQDAYTVLEPLMLALNTDKLATVRVFGRWFNSQFAANYVSASDRYSAINITNTNTIEWRLPRFRTSAQYRNCLKVCATLTKTIITNYMSYTGESQAKREHKAEITAVKLVKQWEKLSATAPDWIDANGETPYEVAGRADMREWAL